MATQEELDLLEKYSSPGLKRNALSRWAKWWHLSDTYRMTPEERKKLLDELYQVKNG